MAYDGAIKISTDLDASGLQQQANKMGDIIKGLGIFSILQKGVDMVAQSVDAAVSRVDTLNKYPKVMQQMGYGADQAANSIKTLSDGIQGLPTTLDGIAASTRQLTIATGSLDTGTKSALALNNAFLASGASAGEAERGLVQYVQMLSSGKVDMQSWRTLNETMTYGLQKTAESFGFAGASAKNDLYAALRDGDITFDKFNSHIIELNEGVGGFAEVAKTATGGIGTAMANMQTAVVRGTANVITQIDKGFSKTRFKSIENIITDSGKAMNKVLNNVANVAGFAAENIETIGPAAVTVGAIFVAWKIGTVLSSVTREFGIINAALFQFSLLSKKTTLDQAVLNGTLSTSQIVVGVLTGQIKLATAAQYGWNTAMSANSVGVVLAAVAAAGVVIGLLAKQTKNANAEFDALTATAKDTSKTIKEINSNFDESERNSKATAVAASGLVGELDKLESQGNLTNAQQRKYAQIVKQINELLPGVNVSIDSQTGFIKDGTKALKDRIEAQKKFFIEEERMKRNQALYEQQAKLIVDLEDSELKLNETKEKRLVLERKISELTGVSVEQLSKCTAEMRLNGQELANLALVNGEYSTEVENLGNQIYSIVLDEGKLSEAVRINQDAVEENGIALAGSEENLSKFREENGLASEAVSQFTGTLKDSFASLSDTQKTALEQMTTAYDTMTSGLGDLSKKIVLDSKTTWKQVQINQADAIKKTQEFTDLYGQLINAGISDSYLKAIGATGPESIPLLKGMLNSGIDTVKSKEGEWQQAFKDVADKGVSAFGLDSREAVAVKDYILGESGIFGNLKSAVDEADFKSLGFGCMEDFSSGIPEGTKEAVGKTKVAAFEMAEAMRGSIKSEKLENVGKSMGDDIASGIDLGGVVASNAGASVAGNIAEVTAAGIKQAGFNLMGENISTGVSKGITTAAPMAEMASRQMMMGVEKAAKDQAQIHSPSVVFDNIGGFIAVGLGDGIDRRSDVAIKAAKNLMTSVIDIFSSAKPCAEDSGVQVMAGLLEGIVKMEPVLYAKVDTIANNIVSRLKKALQVHSPSRKTQYISEMVMRGLITGLKDEEQSLYSQIDDIAGGVVDRFNTIPDGLASELVGRMSLAVDTNQANFVNSSPNRGYYGNITNSSSVAMGGLTQNFYSPTAPSPAEATQRGLAFLEQAKWKLQQQP